MGAERHELEEPPGLADLHKSQEVHPLVFGFSCNPPSPLSALVDGRWSRSVKRTEQGVDPATVATSHAERLEVTHCAARPFDLSQRRGTAQRRHGARMAPTIPGTPATVSRKRNRMLQRRKDSAFSGSYKRAPKKGSTYSHWSGVLKIVKSAMRHKVRRRTRAYMTSWASRISWSVKVSFPLAFATSAARSADGCLYLRRPSHHQHHLQRADGRSDGPGDHVEAPAEETDHGVGDLVAGRFGFPVDDFDRFEFLSIRILLSWVARARRQGCCGPRRCRPDGSWSSLADRSDQRPESGIGDGDSRRTFMRPGGYKVRTRDVCTSGIWTMHHFQRLSVRRREGFGPL